MTDLPAADDELLFFSIDGEELEGSFEFVIWVLENLYWNAKEA